VAANSARPLNEGRRGENEHACPYNGDASMSINRSGASIPANGEAIEEKEKRNGQAKTDKPRNLKAARSQCLYFDKAVILTNA
jgi:hypothetical protein